MKIYRLISAGIISASFANNALATDGYFAHGYGVKAQGLGGVGIALPQDAIASAINPAGLGLIGNRADVGITWFQPVRQSQITGSVAPINGTYDGNGNDDFVIPELGYNRQLNRDWTVGVSVYGNGGMNTYYKNGVPLLGNKGHAGVDLTQAFIAPTVTWKLTPKHTLGVAVNLAYQRFAAFGLQNFANPFFSTSPANVTNRGYDDGYAIGVHIGWIGEITDKVTLGASYQSRTFSTKFEKYQGLFAEQGSFDIPSTYGFGIALKATPQITVAADVQRINYSEVAAVGRLSLANINNGLGSDNGAGFGWQDITSVKVGTSYAFNDKLTLRVGYNYSDQAIRNSDTLFNILAPATIQHHLTLGATWLLPNKAQLSVSYIHAFDNTIHGTNSIPANFGGGNANLSMYQNSVGVAYGFNF